MLIKFYTINSIDFNAEYPTLIKSYLIKSDKPSPCVTRFRITRNSTMYALCGIPLMHFSCNVEFRKCALRED